MEVLHNNANGDILHNYAVRGEDAITIAKRKNKYRNANGEVLQNNACNPCGYNNFLGIGSKVPFAVKVGLTIGGLVLAAYLIKSITK